MAEVLEKHGLLSHADEATARDIQEIRSTCRQEHTKENLIECTECWSRALDRIRRRYFDSTSPEWFTGRRAFLGELEDSLNAVGALELDPNQLDGLLEQGKKQWYVDSVRNSVIQSAAVDGDEALKERLDRQDGDVNAVAGAIRNALDLDSSEEEATDALLSRLGAVSVMEERQKLLANGLFAVGPDQGVADEDRPYYEQLLAGVSVRSVAEEIAGNVHAAQQARNEEAKWKQRTVEMRRAKAALETERSRKNGEPRPQPPERFYHLRNCITCGRERDGSDMISCPLCEVFEDKGIELPRFGAWCSTKCYASTHEEHVEVLPSHSCVAGDACVRLTDDDVEMDSIGGGTVYLCNECVDALEEPSVFCSPRCAEANFQKHREDVHLPRRAAIGIEADDEDKLARTDSDPSRYFPKDVNDHITALDGALRTLEKETGVSIERLE